MKNISGPSGSTHPPVLRLNTGDTLSSKAANSPARSLNNRLVSRYSSHVVPANSTMNGSRINSPLSLCASFASTPGIQNDNGGWSK